MSASRAVSLVTGAAMVLAGTLGAPSQVAAEASATGESVEQALCRLIDAAAARQNLPAEFFTRLLWQESSFRPGVTSSAGAQGIAQFMPGTAHERGLADPFDPEQAIPASAAFLADLVSRFGNRGLAAAAYNAGPNRVAAWLAGRGGLPLETEDYVARVTGRAAQAWADDLKRQGPPSPSEPSGPARSCSTVAKEIRAVVPALSRIAQAALAPWGVQLSGNFSKSLALASFERARGRLQALIGSAQPMIIGTRLRSRGTRAFYRVRVPAQSRAEADALCTRIRNARGACFVLRS